jgi:hypothetical protein
MTHQLYIQCVIATLIGNVLHVAFKILSLWKSSKKANLEFSIKGYFKDDAWPLIVDFMASFALVYVIDEWLSFNEFIIGKIKSIFIFIGFTGSYVILLLMSVAEKKLQAAISHKSSIADETTGNKDKPTPK